MIWDVGEALFFFWPEQIWRFDKATKTARSLSWDGASLKHAVPADDRLYVTLAHRMATTGLESRQVVVLTREGEPIPDDPWHQKEIPSRSLVAGVDSRYLYLYRPASGPWGVSVYDRNNPSLPHGEISWMNEEWDRVPEGAVEYERPTANDMVVDWPWIYLAVPGPYYQETTVTIRVDTAWQQLWRTLGENIRDIWLRAYEEVRDLQQQELPREEQWKKVDELLLKYGEELLPAFGRDPNDPEANYWLVLTLSKPSWGRDTTPHFQAIHQAKERYGWREERGYFIDARQIVTATSEYADYKLFVRKTLPARVYILQVES